MIPVVLHYSTADQLGLTRRPEETKMARAQGARALMALAFETTYGTPPVSGFTRMPFASTSLGAEQPLLNRNDRLRSRSLASMARTLLNEIARPGSLLAGISAGGADRRPADHHRHPVA